MRTLVAIVLSLSLAGCATSYHAKGLFGRYSETQLGEDVFQVTFVGNGHTSEERATDFGLLRSAELTLQHGYRFFVQINLDESKDLATVEVPFHLQTAGTAYGSGRVMFLNASTMDSYVVARPTASNLIRCFKERPAGDRIVFDAELVVKSITEKYGMAKRNDGDVREAVPASD